LPVGPVTGAAGNIVAILWATPNALQLSLRYVR